MTVPRQTLIKRPLEIWPRVAMGIARSSLFLTLFVAVGFGGELGSYVLYPFNVITVCKSYFDPSWHAPDPEMRP